MEISAPAFSPKRVHVFGLKSSVSEGKSARFTFSRGWAHLANVPIQEVWEMDGRGERQAKGHFDFDRMLGRLEKGLPTCERGTGIFAWDLPAQPIGRTVRAVRAQSGATI